MSGRQDVERDLEPDLSSAAFLAGLGADRADGVHGEKGQEEAFSLYVLVRRLRDRWVPGLRWVARRFSWVIPKGILDWISCQLHDGTIWEQGPAGAYGPGDTCALGHQVRRQRDRELGFRLIESAYPIIILVGLMATIFSCLRIVSYNQQVYAESKRVQTTTPPVETHSSVFDTHHVSRRW
jgi:hypothetical protein